MLIGTVAGWSFTEYYFHRFILHEELNLDMDAPADGKKNAAIFSRHVHHHVFMNQKNRIVINLFKSAHLIVGVFAVLSFLLVSGKKYHVLAGWLIGCGLYDWLHLSFHFGPELPFAFW